MRAFVLLVALASFAYASSAAVETVYLEETGSPVSIDPVHGDPINVAPDAAQVKADALLAVDAGVEPSGEATRAARQFFGRYPGYGGYGGYGGFGRPYGGYGGYGGFGRPYGGYGGYGGFGRYPGYYG